MRLISLMEPWATLMALEFKHIETRDWMTAYRGPLAIHASKHGMSLQDTLAQCIETEFYDALMTYQPFREVAIRHGDRRQIPKDRMKQAFPNRGKILCVVNLVNCWPTDSAALSQVLTSPEAAFGNYAPYRFGWVTEHIFTLSEPIPFTSKQGLVFVPEDTRTQMRDQFTAEEATWNS